MTCGTANSRGDSCSIRSTQSQTNCKYMNYLHKNTIFAKHYISKQNKYEN